jgi:hypothetical protein
VSNGTLLTVTELASQLNVSPALIYREADKLGALRIGGSLRFDPARARAALMAPAEPDKPKPPKRRRPKRRLSRQSRPKERDGYYQATSRGP